MISLLLYTVWMGCETADKNGTPNPIDVPLEIDSVTVIPSQGVRSDSYLQCVPSIRGADYETLEIRYIWYNETSQTDYVDADMVRKEVTDANRLFQRNNWKVIDVSRRSVEETAAAILNKLSEQRNA